VITSVQYVTIEGWTHTRTTQKQNASGG